MFRSSPHISPGLRPRPTTNLGNDLPQRNAQGDDPLGEAVIRTAENAMAQGTARAVERPLRIEDAPKWRMPGSSKAKSRSAYLIGRRVYLREFDAKASGAGTLRGWDQWWDCGLLLFELSHPSRTGTGRDDFIP